MRIMYNDYVTEYDRERDESKTTLQVKCVEFGAFMRKGSRITFFKKANCEDRLYAMDFKNTSYAVDVAERILEKGYANLCD